MMMILLKKIMTKEELTVQEEVMAEYVKVKKGVYSLFNPSLPFFSFRSLQWR